MCAYLHFKSTNARGCKQYDVRNLELHGSRGAVSELWCDRCVVCCLNILTWTIRIVIQELVSFDVGDKYEV